MASIGQTSSNKVKHIQSLLEREIERVNELKRLLATAEQEVERLKRELAECQQATSSAVISNCPSEILSMIFELSISDGRDVVQIGRLLLVCKHWHAVVINDPYIWNRIHISVPVQWDIRSWSRSTESYIKCCIERSRNSRLHINLNFSGLYTIRQQIAERVQYGFLNLSPIAQSGVSLISEWLEDLDYEPLEGNIGTDMECLPHHAIDLIGHLSTRLEVVRRWESLVIHAPSDVDLLKDIWELVSPGGVNLSQIHLNGWNWQDLPERYCELEEDTPLLTIPHVKDLKIESLTSCYYLLSFDPSSLRKLCVCLESHEEFFVQMARFEQLTTLILITEPWHAPVDPNLSPRISLRKLQELVVTVKRDVKDLESVRFDSPNLNRLVIETLIVEPLATRLRVQPREVRWVPDYPHSEILSVAHTVIRDFLLHYSDSETLSIPAFLKEIALETLKELVADQLLPPKWKTILLHEAPKDPERIDTSASGPNQREDLEGQKDPESAQCQ